MNEHTAKNQIATEEQRPVRVVALGFDETVIQSLKLVFKHHARDAFRLVEPEDAEVFVFDIDHADGQRFWRAHKETHPCLSTILVSGSGHKPDGVCIVEKPISASKLVSAITAAANGTTRGAVGKEQQPTVKKGSPRMRGVASSLNSRIYDRDQLPQAVRRSIPTGQALYYDPNDFVLGAVLKALAQAKEQVKIAHIRCSRDRNIVLDPEGDQVLTDVSDKHLRSMGAVTVHGSDGISVKVKLHKRKTLPALIDPEAAGTTAWSLESFIWKLTLVTARGRVPLGTDLQKPVYLKQWPNLTRLEKTPEAARIVALWVRQPRSILSLFGTLMVPLEHILDLYGATCAIGLAGVARRKVDELEPHDPKVHRHRNLLSSVIRRLNDLTNR